MAIPLFGVGGNIIGILTEIGEELDLHAHHGDTEAIYLLVHRYKYNTWRLEKIIWKRHFDKPAYGEWEFNTSLKNYNYSN